MTEKSPTPMDPGKLSIVASSGLSPGKFSFWDYLAGRSDGPEIALAYGSLLWPQFVRVSGFILLEEHYDEAYFERVLRDYGPAKVEATINTTYLDNIVGAKDVEQEVLEALGALLCETWVARAKLMFPDLDFVAQFDWYSDKGDPGITIFHK